MHTKRPSGTSCRHPPVRLSVNRTCDKSWLTPTHGVCGRRWVKFWCRQGRSFIRYCMSCLDGRNAHAAEHQFFIFSEKDVSRKLRALRLLLGISGELPRLEARRPTGQDYINMEFIFDAEARRTRRPKIATTPSPTLRH